MTGKAGKSGRPYHWRDDVCGWVWAKVEFLRWRDGESISSACRKLACDGVTFEIPRGRGPDEPEFACHWENGELVYTYPPVATYEYRADQERQEGAVDTGKHNLRQLYYAAKNRMCDKPRVDDDARFKLSLLKQDHQGGFLAGVVDSKKI